MQLFRRIGGGAISISERGISIQLGGPYLHNLEGPALRRRPRAFASNVRVETDLRILGELLVEARGGGGAERR